jgi:hypothetical protein
MGRETPGLDRRPRRGTRRTTRARHAAVAALLVTLALAACSDDDDDSAPTTTGVSTTVTTAAPTTTSTTVPGPSTTAELSADAQRMRAVVFDFAEDQVGMVEPVVGELTIQDGSPRTGRAKVWPRREDGSMDLSLPSTQVELVAEGDTWRIVSATSENLTIESPPEGMSLIAGFVTPSGRATAFEGTVVVQALVGTDVVAEVVTTAEGIEDAPWAARLELGQARGDGYILAFTTAGTSRGAPVFAAVPVVIGS